MKRSPFKFIICVFMLSLPFWLLDTFVKRLPLPISLPVSALQFVCPLIVACIFVYREAKFDGVGKLLKRVFEVKRIKHKIWYLPLFFLKPLIMVLAYFVMLLLGRPMPAPQIPFLMIPLFFVIFFLAAASEEVGWTGYVTDPMQERWGAFTTGLILGIVWAGWHIIPELSIHTPIWVAGQFLSTVMSRILIVWLYNNTGKSVFTAIVYHDMMNVSEFSFPNYGSYYDPVIGGTITGVIALIVTFLWGTRTLARFRYAVRRSSEVTRKGRE